MFYQKSTTLPVTAADAYAWHARPGAFARLAPPWEAVEVVVPPTLVEGTQACFQMRTGPIKLTWLAEHTYIEPDVEFVDEQRKGPFSLWRHRHRFAPGNEPRDGTCRLIDEVEYELPLGALGQAVAGRYVRARLDRMFSFRHQTTTDDLMAHRTLNAGKSLQVAVSGSQGLIGSALQHFLSTGGHHVVPLSRRVQHASEEIGWNPTTGQIDADRLEGLDAVVHLAGESVFGDRWNHTKRQKILQSRVQGTSLLAETLAALKKPPKVMVCASAIGFYGDTEDRWVDERAPRGAGFLAEVCEAWEAAAEAARQAGIRVVHLRFGIVLSPSGGALAKQLPLFQMGLGGPIGRGDQWLSFLSLDDALDIVLRAIVDERLSGAVNAVAPQPVRQREFAHTLGRVLSRPAVVSAPRWGLKLALGDAQASEMLLNGQRVRPQQLLDVGHRFRFPDLEATLRHCLGK